MARGSADKDSGTGPSLVSDVSGTFSGKAGEGASGIATEDSAGESSATPPLPGLRFFLEDFGGAGGGAPGTYRCVCVGVSDMSTMSFVDLLRLSCSTDCIVQSRES